MTRLQGSKCRLLVSQQPDATEVLDFLSSGLEVGQQIIVMASPGRLKDLAQSLRAMRLRPDILLRNGRAIFLTAPECFRRLERPDALRLNGSVVRWVSDWSWAYENGHSLEDILGYQRSIHGRIHELTALSLCTVHCSRLERSSMLQMLGQHRRALRSILQAV